MGPFYVQCPFYYGAFLCTITLFKLRIHPMLHPLYIKRTHNRINKITLSMGQFYVQ